MIRENLGELVNIQTGKLDANASSDRGAFPFFTCAKKPLRIDNWNYDLDAVLIAGNGDLNVKHYSGKFDAYQRTYILDVQKKERLDTKYLFHFMETYLDTLRQQSIGGIIKYIKLGMLKDAVIPLPPLEEQKRIAAILDQADALRRLRQRALDRLNTLGQSIFYEMFSQHLQRNGQGEPLSEHIEFITSGGRGWAKYYAPVGERFVRSLDVQMNSIGTDDVVYVEPPDNAEARRTRISEEDVLLTITGSKIGRVAPAPKYLDGAFISQHVAIIRLNTSAMNPVFLSFFLSLIDGGQRQIKKMQYGQAKPGLNFQQIRSFMIPKVVITDQMLFRERLEKLNDLISSFQRDVDQMADLFASLQQRAFRGEL